MTYAPLSGTSALSLDWSSAQSFFSILTHDDRASYYCIARRDDSGAWNESYVSAEQLEGYTMFDHNADWYLSRNGFTQRSRKSERLRQVNAFMFDLDCHQGNARVAVSEGIHAIEAAVRKGILPDPTMIVDTGRGLHLYYVLDRSLPYRLRGGYYNEKGISFFRDVESKLLAALQQVLLGVPSLEIDTAVFDFSRVGRIPGTYNIAAGRYAKLVSCSKLFYTLSQLADACVMGASLVSAMQSSKQASGASASQNCSRSRFVVFDKLALSRVGKIYMLQELRGFDCTGDRELMCFCLYNSAVQIFPHKNDAVEKLAEFNARFIQPLSDQVLSQIARSVDKIGFYKMSAATIVSKLKMSVQEIECTSFFESRRMIERRKAKLATAEKRARRDALILSLYALPGETMQSVAQKVGVCKRTVANVVKRAREMACAASDGQKKMVNLKQLAQEALNTKIVKAKKECIFLADVFMSASSPSSASSVSLSFEGHSLSFGLFQEPSSA